MNAEGKNSMTRIDARIWKLIGSILIAFLIVAGVMTIACEDYAIPIRPEFIYGTAALISAALFCLSYSRASAWITLLALTAAALVAVIAGWHPTERTAGILANLRADGNLRPYARDLTALALLAAYAAVYTVVCQPNSACAMAATVLAGLAFLWFSRASSASIHILPVLAGLSALFAREGFPGSSRLKALVSLSLVSAVLACAVVPGAGVKAPVLEEASHKALYRIMRLFNIDKDNLDERRSFTIASDGWLTRKDYIGGPAYPREDELLRVQTPESVYLRGAIRYIYNNRAWVDEDNESKAGKIKRYMLSGIEGLVYRDEFDRAFDLDKESTDSFFRAETLTVDVLADNAFWSIYSPNRTESVTLDGEVSAYYNNVGELFAGRPLAAGDRYQLKVNVLDIPEDELARAIASQRGEKDGAYASVLLLNRDLPAGIEPELYALTYEIIAGLETPYEKACALRDWLSRNGTYTLRGDYPPDDRDFASWFALDSLRGYCAYYACAMTVMARIAGLPARYVEGYHVSPDESGECVVTGRNAHAWTEVYFENFGWLTFDATPASVPGSDGNGSYGASGEDDPGEGEAEPSPTPTPTPTPTAPPRSTPEPTKAPESNERTDEPTNAPPSAEPDDSPPSDAFGDPFDDPADPEKGASSHWWLLILLLALIAALALLIRARIRNTHPAAMARAEKNAENRLMIWYRAMLTALAASGISYENGMTPVLFAEKARAANACTDDFAAFSREVARCRYAETQAAEETYRLASRAYAGIRARMRWTAKIRWTVRRVFFGIGRLDPVP